MRTFTDRMTLVVPVLVACLLTAAAPAHAAAPAPIPISTLTVHLGDIPDSQPAREAALQQAVDLVLPRQAATGSFEIPGKVRDVGDNSLGVSSLLALEWFRSGGTETRLVAPERRSVDWFLANRVYTVDDPCYAKLLRIPDSGAAYARYTIAEDCATANGAWPTTAWALLHTGDLLRYGDGLLTTSERASLEDLGLSYWRWLTQASKFNVQDADNQAIASLDGAFLLSNQLRRFGREAEADRLNAEATALYRDVVRPHRETDRGFTFFGEHSGGYDQNYGGIALSFLYEAYVQSGQRVFLEDGEQMARYIDTRLSSRGFDYGGPRHFETHGSFEAVLGLRAFSGVIHADLGRYLASARFSYWHNDAEGGVLVPNGHFAFMTIWTMEDGSSWFRTPRPADTTYKMRVGSTSIAFDADLQPYLVTADGVDVMESIAGGRPGVGLYERDASGVHLLPVVPGSARSVELRLGGTAIKLVTSRVSIPSGGSAPVRTAYVTDGTSIEVVTAAPASLGGAGGEIGWLAGLPYATDIPGTSQQQKVQGVAAPDGRTLSFATDGGSIVDASRVLAGPLAVRGGAGVRVENPPAASDHAFSSSLTIGKTAELYTLGLDPGNPNLGWAATERTNWVEAPAGPDGLVSVTYGPNAASGGRLAALARGLLAGPGR